MDTSTDFRTGTRNLSPALFALALLLVGINLRPALSSVAPVLGAIRDGTGLSATGAGALTTLPILCFGLIAPLGPLCMQRFSPERTISWGLVLLAAGILLRVFFGLPGLFLGTLLLGSSIGIVMVLLPGMIKRDFSRHVGFMTGLYTMALCLGAALAAGVSVPIQSSAGGDWRASLGIWALPALAAAGTWSIVSRRNQIPRDQPRYRVAGLRFSGLAWKVACFMGLQSVLAYCVFGWLPTILIDRGLAPLNAGAVLSISIAAQLPAAFAGPWIAGKGQDQRMAATLFILLTVIGLFACMYAPLDQVWWWSVLLGIGQGGAFSIATMLVVLRSPNTQVVGALSGMTQLVGYLLAACGPFVAGVLRDFTGGWDAAAVFFGIVAIAALAVGLGAGRKQYVRASVEQIGPVPAPAA